MPTNLRELVEAGVALGVRARARTREPALRAVLFDAATRERLPAARARLLSERGHGRRTAEATATGSLASCVRRHERRAPARAW